MQQNPPSDLFMSPSKQLFAILVLCLGLPLLATAKPASAPNIVLIIADDQAWNDHGFMGHPQVRTPNLDQLAETGLLFSHGYVPTALCRPSLASIMTSLYPHQHGITGNRIGGPREQRAAQEQALAAEFSHLPRLAALLGEAGYRSLHTGKWWEGDYRNGGFSHGMGENEGVNIGRETMQPLFDFINDSGDTPFFIWYAPYLPHFPHNPPQRLLAHYQQQQLHPALANYYAMIEWTDETVGQLLAHLERSGKADNTIVLYLVDNGWIQPTTAINDHPWYFGAPRGKGSPFDTGVRTPIILHWPGHIAPTTVTHPVSSLDIAPTLLRLAGEPVPASMEGIDLLNAEAVARRDAVYGASFKHNMNPRAAPEQALLNRWVVSGEWKLIQHKQGKGRPAGVELFHLGRDPYEQKDLAAENADVVSRLLVLMGGQGSE